MLDHQRAHVGISQFLSGDAERSEHVSVTDELPPIAIARSGRWPHMAGIVSHAATPHRRGPLRPSRTAAERRDSRGWPSPMHRPSRESHQLETYPPLVTEVEQVSDDLTGLKAQPVEPDPGTPITGIAAEAWSTETGSRLTIPELAARPEGVKMIVVPVVRDLQQPVKVLQCPVSPTRVSGSRHGRRRASHGRCRPWIRFMYPRRA